MSSISNLSCSETAAAFAKRGHISRVNRHPAWPGLPKVKIGRMRRAESRLSLRRMVFVHAARKRPRRADSDAAYMAAFLAGFKVFLPGLTLVTCETNLLVNGLIRAGGNPPPGGASKG